MLRFPKAVRPLDKLPCDLRRGEFDTIALRLVTLRRNSKLHLVKPNILIHAVRLLRAEADCHIRGIVVFSRIYNLIVVLRLPQNGRKIGGHKIVYIQRQLSGNEFFYHFVRAVVRIKDRFRYLYGHFRTNGLRHAHGRSVFLFAALFNRDRRTVKITQTNSCHSFYTSVCS